MAGDPMDPPRVAWRPQADDCDRAPGPCTELCSGAPHTCEASACSSLVIDTGSPFSLLATKASKATVDRECIALRAGDGAGGTDLMTTRMRFEQVPTVRIPVSMDKEAVWRTGSSEPDEQGAGGLDYASGVLGGTFIASFTLRFVDGGHGARNLSIYRNYPSVEARPGARSPASIDPQYPGRLLGQERGDDCRFGDDQDCAIAGSIDAQVEEARINAPSMLVADTCVAPPPCELQPPRGWPTEQEQGAECLRQRGKWDGRSCEAIDDVERGGISASFLVATGVPGTIMFGDSVRRSFGPLDELPVCPANGAMPPDQRVCRMPEAVDLPLIGWAHYSGLVQLRIRSLALVSGADASESPPPCRRLAQRFQASGETCDNYLQRGTPDDSEANGEAGQELDGSRQRAGMVDYLWLRDTAEIDPENRARTSGRLLTATVLPETTFYARSMRQVAGSAAIELDGVIGSTLLQGTDMVFDYGEGDLNPGLRAHCYGEHLDGCQAQAACVRDGDGASESCCQGLPEDLIIETICSRHSDFDPGVLGNTDRCCALLSDETVAEIRAKWPAACPEIELPAELKAIPPEELRFVCDRIRQEAHHR